jgi:uncharacterized lipoprotein YmbA
MIRKALPLTLAAAGAILLGACGHSAPTHLLTLDLAPPATASASYAGPPLRLTAVQVPPAIDRLEFASSVSATELRLQDQYRWSASLGSLARGVLLRDLAARLPEGALLPPDSPAGKGTRRVDVAILALNTGPTNTTMEVMVTVAIDGSPRLLRRSYSLKRDHAPSQTPAQDAADYSSMLGDVADAIRDLAVQLGTAS